MVWKDLDVENRTISITKQVTRTKGELVVSQPKTHNSIRVLPVSQQAVELLMEEHKKHPGNMKALCYRFETTSRRAEYLDRKIERTYRQLTRLLDEPERKLLLKMADLEDALREEACLNSFISGYRLAQGIQQELLADQPPYNFENEDEQRACELAGKER